MLLCIFLTFPNYAQTSMPAADERWREAGLPYIRMYGANEYNSDPQNWDIVQDRRGVIYVANNSGVLEYDGVSWRQIIPGTRMTVTTLNMDKNGRIWVGAGREFGYLAPDSVGSLKHISLLGRIPLQDREREYGWGVAVTSQGVYFDTENVLFRWSGRSSALKVWRPETKFDLTYVVGDELHIPQTGVGLMRMEGDSLRLMSGGERFAHMLIRDLIPLSDSRKASADRDNPHQSEGHTNANNNDRMRKRFLIATSANGLFVYDGVDFYPFKTEADAFLLQNRLSCGAVLADGRYALGTLHGGIAIINEQGKLQLILNKATGLPDNTVKQAYLDTQGGLWLALNMGLARIELASPITLHSEASGLQSGVEGVQRHNGKVYATTADGIYTMEQSSWRGGPPAFQPVTGVKAHCRKLLSADSQLLVTTDKGICQIENNQSKPNKKFDTKEPLSLLRSRYDQNRLYVGFRHGFGVMQSRDGRWIFAGYVPGIYEIIEGIAEDGPDSLWLTTRYGDVSLLRTESIQLSALYDSATVQIERFGERHELDRGWVNPIAVNGKVVFSTDYGLRNFDPETQTFELSSSFGGVFADAAWDLGDTFFAVDDIGRVWTSRIFGDKTEVGVAVPNPDGSYSWHTTPFRRFADFGGIWNFHIDEKHKGVYWFGGADGIVRYDDTIENNYEASYPSLIRRVTVNGDSVIYGGAYSNPGAIIKAPTLVYEDNQVGIEYAAPYYDNEAANQNQYFMEGFDDDWSDWTSETNANYRKLPEGHYRFRVRSRNIYQNIGDESVFAFKILPPWYRTWWNYSFCGLMTLGVLYAIRRYEKNRQQFKHRAELQSVETQKLKELDKLKSDFFANISHEFRTPLTMILGPAEQLMQEPSESSKNKGKLIRRNAQRLLRLINQLLDVSKLESGKMPLRASPGDFIGFLKGVVMSFESWAQEREIDLRFDVHPWEGADPSQGLKKTYFDRDKTEKIFFNLLSNALKFTTGGGRIEVGASFKPAHTTGVSKSPLGEPVLSLTKEGAALATGRVIQITVKDTGVGIPADRLPHIFDRFSQADTSSTRTYEGTGIGLALVKELVELHYGTIAVASEEGKGTIFTIGLPLGKEHLRPEEIVEEPAEEDRVAPISINHWDVVEETVVTRHNVPVLSDETPTATNSEGPIILIIEDNADVRAYIREQLEPEYAILEAGDGEAGIAQAIEVIPDLVISDVMMPKRDGFEVCRTLKTDERTSHIPVILLTAKAREKEKLAGLETGADAYVLKPFRRKELAVRVRKLVELRRKLRARFSTATVIKPSEVEATSMDRIFLERVIEIIETHFDDETFNVETLAKEVTMSVSQVNRKLKALIGQPAGQMIRSMRLQRAADLLAKKSGTVAEICYAVGFSDQANFTRSFKKQFGCSPAAYKK